MKAKTLEYFISEAVLSLRRNGLMSFASVSTVALSLLILGIFLMFVLNLNYMASTLESQVQVTVYLEDGLPNEDMRAVGMQISQLPGVTHILFVDKDEAMERFKERLGDQQSLLGALGEENPLPYSFEVKVDRPERVKSTAAAISVLDGVEKAKYGQEIIDQLFQLTKTVRIFGFVLIVFLALAALFIISNTIRLTVFARRKEIGIMKYVGATDWFIRWPFLIEGMILGFGGAVLAVLILGRTYSAIANQIYASMAFLPLIPATPFVGNISMLIIVIGTVIGALGSTISLKRFMKV